MNVNNYYNFLPVAQDTHSQVSGMQEKSKLAEVSTDSELLSSFYNELNNISVILSNPATTEEQAVNELGKYNEIIKSPEFLKLTSSQNSEFSYKIIDVKESIEYFFLKKEMVTFGYFVDKMDVASKYGYNLNVKYYRDGFSQYTEFYKTMSKLLSSYGEYSAGVIDDGKKTKFKQDLFYYDLHLKLMNYYPVTGDLKNSDGKDCSIYKGRFEIDTRNGIDNCSTYIDGELIDSGVNYSDAIKKWSIFSPL